MPSNPNADLIDLSADDLDSLRLAAQVMAHRAQLAGRPAVALYFDSLESAILAEVAGRGQLSVGGRLPAGVLVPEENDRAVAAEYLGLLADNARLSPAVRDYCRVLMLRLATGARSDA